MPHASRGLEGRIQKFLQGAEDTIHLVVAVLLILLGGILLVGVVGDLVDALNGPYHETTIVLSTLDNGLVLFIVAELLHTVRLTIRNRTLDAEPFLVVGLIAGIRKVLIVTAEAEGSFRWDPQGIELVVLVGLIFVMAPAVLVWRRATRPHDFALLKGAGPWRDTAHGVAEPTRRTAARASRATWSERQDSTWSRSTPRMRSTRCSRS